MEPRAESFSSPPSEPTAASHPASGGSPEHELRNRTKAAKLRHKAAKARMKATRMTERAHHLNGKAAEWERKANELDGVATPTG